MKMQTKDNIIDSNIESVIDSGKYPAVCTLLPIPTPNNPPDPIAIRALLI